MTFKLYCFHGICVCERKNEILGRNEKHNSITINDFATFTIIFNFRARKIPMIIRRYLPDGSFEDWGIDELIITEWDMTLFCLTGKVYDTCTLIDLKHTGGKYRTCVHHTDNLKIASNIIRIIEKNYS